MQHAVDHRVFRKGVVEEAIDGQAQHLVGLRTEEAGREFHLPTHQSKAIEMARRKSWLRRPLLAFSLAGRARRGSALTAVRALAPIRCILRYSLYVSFGVGLGSFIRSIRPHFAAAFDAFR
jgi:hypothetical protein